MLHLIALCMLRRDSCWYSDPAWQKLNCFILGNLLLLLWIIEFIWCCQALNIKGWIDIIDHWQCCWCSGYWQSDAVVALSNKPLVKGSVEIGAFTLEFKARWVMYWTCSECKTSRPSLDSQVLSVKVKKGNGATAFSCGCSQTPI